MAIIDSFYSVWLLTVHTLEVVDFHVANERNDDARWNIRSHEREKVMRIRR